jgi:hypothetical protein
MATPSTTLSPRGDLSNFPSLVIHEVDDGKPGGARTGPAGFSRYCKLGIQQMTAAASSQLHSRHGRKAG